MGRFASLRRKLFTGDQIWTLSYEEIKRYLDVEMDEFMFELEGADNFDKDKAIDEAWDVWTNITNLLLSKGVSYKELYKGHYKNMSKKINRGYRYKERSEK